MFQHFAEAIVPLLKEREKLMQEHADLKLKFDREHDEQADSKRSFQKEFEMLQTFFSRIKEYVSWTYEFMPIITIEINFCLFWHTVKVS